MTKFVVDYHCCFLVDVYAPPIDKKWHMTQAYKMHDDIALQNKYHLAEKDTIY
jgi:hypothetical protein